MVKITRQHAGTVKGYGHMHMSGLAEMYIDTDDAGIEVIHGDWRMIDNIADAFPEGSRCQIFLTEDDPFNWHVTDEDTDLSEPEGESGSAYC